MKNEGENMDEGKRNPSWDRKLVRIGGSVVVALPKEARTIASLFVGRKVRMVATSDGIFITMIGKNNERVKV